MTTLASENSNRLPLSPDADAVCCMNKLSLESVYPDCVSDSHVADKQHTTTNTRTFSNSHHIDTQSDTSTSSVTESGVNGTDVTEDLSDRIRRQIEYYFSKENYRNDQYLLSQSDGDQYVSVATLATFPAVKNLSADLDFITEALRGSDQLELDSSENKVRPNLKRCILILRDIPEDTLPEEIEALFDEEGLPDVKDRIEFAINSNCYVRFDSETDAHAAFHSVINKTFNGRPIYPRLKSASSSLQPPPEIPNQFTTRPYDQYQLYNYQAFPMPYMHPAPVPSWSPIDPIMYPSYLKPFLVPRLIPVQRLFPHKQSDYLVSPVTRNGGFEFSQTSPSSSRHHSSSGDTHGRDQQPGGESHGEGRSSRRKTGGKYPSREEKKAERIPTPKMDTDSFPPLPTSPGIHSFWSAPTTPQTSAEPTNKTLSDIVRKGQSPQPRHSAANPPPSLGRGRGRPAVHSPVPEVGERDSEFIQKSEVSRPLGRGRRPKAQSTSEPPNQSGQLPGQTRSQSESGEKDTLKSEKLSYAQMAQKVPPPPPPPLPEAANYLPPSPPLSNSPNTPSQSNTFFKDSSDTFFNGSSRSFQDNDNKQRKHLVRVSNGPMNRGVRGYNGSDSSKPHRKGGYSNSRNSRERRAVHQDRDSSLRDH